MQNIYCISGLGADQRIFQKMNITGAALVPVFWADYDQHDDLSCYAQKLSARITEDNPVILGLSFGGMLAAEIAKMRPVKQVFLISSAKDATELPPVGRFARFIVKNELIPLGLSGLAHRQLYKRFGVETDDEKALLTDILRHTDKGFTKWAMKAIIDWNSTAHTDHIIHIHGTADRMIDPAYVKPDYWIDGGTHFMVYQRAAEISKLIEKHLV